MAVLMTPRGAHLKLAIGQECRKILRSILFVLFAKRDK